MTDQKVLPLSLPLSPAMLDLLGHLAKNPQVNVGYGVRGDYAHAWIPMLGHLHAPQPRTVYALRRRGLLEAIRDRNHEKFDWRWTVYLLTDKGRSVIRALKKAGEL